MKTDSFRAVLACLFFSITWSLGLAEELRLDRRAVHVPLSPDPNAEITSISLAEDTEAIAVTSGPRLYVIDLRADAHPVATQLPEGFRFIATTFLRGAKSLRAINDDGAVFDCAAPDWLPMRVKAIQAGRVDRVCWLDPAIGAFAVGSPRLAKIFWPGHADNLLSVPVPQDRVLTLAYSRKEHMIFAAGLRSVEIEKNVFDETSRIDAISLGKRRIVSSLGYEGGIVQSIAVGSSGRLVASACTSSRIQVYQLPDMVVKCAFQSEVRNVNSLVFSPHESYLISAGGHPSLLKPDNSRGSIEFWHIRSGTRCLQFPTPLENDWVTCMALSQDGKTLAVGTHRSQCFLLRVSFGEEGK